MGEMDIHLKRLDSFSCASQVGLAWGLAEAVFWMGCVLVRLDIQTGHLVDTIVSQSV